MCHREPYNRCVRIRASKDGSMRRRLVGIAGAWMCVYFPKGDKFLRCEEVAGFIINVDASGLKWRSWQKLCVGVIILVSIPHSLFLPFFSSLMKSWTITCSDEEC